ncbi:MAG: DUF448 domain-containing protein [Alphaproteobacteria bacterium]|nr:DUF448 domain-containing protein [Alphaproteobacteria bacterium]
MKRKGASTRSAPRPDGAVRTCVACRGEAVRDDLIRLVQHPDDGSVVVDLRATLPGRGAWVHPTRVCVEKIEAQPSLLSRAFKGQVRAPGLAAAVRDAVERALLDGLSLAAAGGGLVGGHDAIVQALAGGEIELLVLASDAADRTIRDLLRAAPEGMPAVPVTLDREALGSRVGSAPRAALGVRPTGSTVHLRRQLRRWVGLG